MKGESVQFISILISFSTISLFVRSIVRKLFFLLIAKSVVLFAFSFGIRWNIFFQGLFFIHLQLNSVNFVQLQSVFRSHVLTYDTVLQLQLVMGDTGLRRKAHQEAESHFM